MEQKKLTRLSSDKKLCGVCSGLAKFFGIDPTMVRLGYAALTIFSAGFPGILIYIIGALIIPEE